MCFFTRILETRAFTSSAYNSLAFTAIGIVWAISMSFLVMGLPELSKRGSKESKSDALMGTLNHQLGRRLVRRPLPVLTVSESIVKRPCSELTEAAQPSEAENQS